MDNRDIKTVILTGGLGYIGSHVAVNLLKDGYNVVILDNLSTGTLSNLHGIEKISQKKLHFYEIDLLDSSGLDLVFETVPAHAVIHIAGSKILPESFKKPIAYYRNNFQTTLNVLSAMAKHKVEKFVFSSSAAVYGASTKLPITEKHIISPGSPYGRSKHFSEEAISDWCRASNMRQASCLRYFNPIGNHGSGVIGENRESSSKNLMLEICKVASAAEKKLSVFGDKYDTLDGTCERDFIHVMDLAVAHVACLKKEIPGCDDYNIGTGRPTTVLQLLNAFTKTTGIKIAFEFCHNRHGDIPSVWANPNKFSNEMNWIAPLDLAEMCSSAWKYYNYEH